MCFYMYEDIAFETLKGCVIKEIIGLKKDSDEVTFITDRGNFSLFHEQECCESVTVCEIIGDPADILNEQILIADESSNRDNEPNKPDDLFVGGSWTWTFYRLATIKGSLDIRWLGEGNGYYSEAVTFAKKKESSEDHGVQETKLP